MFLDRLPEPIDDPDKYFDDLIEKMAASPPVDRFRSRNIRAMNETADRILVDLTRDLSKARRNDDHEEEEKCCRQIQKVHEGRKRWEEFYHSPEYASRVTTQWLDCIRENKDKWREEDRQRWEANAAESQKLRAQIEPLLSIVRKMREGNQEAESSFNDDVPELGEPFKTVLEKMLQGPAEAACFLAEDPMNVGVACVMWLAEVECRVRYNRSGLPSQGFYHLTRALQAFGVRQQIPAPRLWEFYCASTANPSELPSDHRLCTSHPSLQQARALARGDIDRLMIAKDFDARALPDMEARVLEACDKIIALAPVFQRMQLQSPQWDKATEARNKWIYDQCMKIVPYDTIILKLKRKPRSWERIESVNGIKSAARAYAKRYGLPEPPPRRSGRSSSKN